VSAQSLNLIDVAKKAIEDLNWDQFRKPYPGDLQKLKSLYWHIVASDIIKDSSLKMEGQADLNPVSLSIARSFTGIFLWPYEILYGQSGLLSHFDGMHIFALEQGKDLLEEWKSQILQERSDAIFNIVYPLKKVSLDPQFITKNHPVGKSPFNWREFNHYYRRKTPVVSRYLKDHLKDGTFWYKDKKSPEIYFNYSLTPRFIDRLHRKGLVVAKTALLHKALSEIEQQKKQKLKDSSISKDITANQWITIPVHERETMDTIIGKILKAAPNLTHLTLSQAKYHILTRFRDSEGKELHPDSVDKALRRSGFRN